jgi:hypothetical protein
MKIVCPTIILSAALGSVAVILLGGESIALSAADGEKQIEDRVLATPEPNYSLNRCFNRGNWDGFRDHKRKQRREHHSLCASQEAQQSYDLGYQQGFAGQLSYRRDHPLSTWARVRTIP